MKNNLRSIKKVIPPPPFHMVGDGFRVHNFFPSDPDIGMYGMSPFFLLDYGSKHIFPPSEKPRGVSAHPHKGFETVTIAYHGAVEHHDSQGNHGIISQGDIQWMTAGSGVLHKEYHEKEYAKRGGLFQMVQLWINLPAKHKMHPPRYQAIKEKDIVKYIMDDGTSSIGIIAGEYMGLKGPAETFTAINLYNAFLSAGSAAEFLFSKKHNTGMLVIDGEIMINDQITASSDHFILFENDGEEIPIRAVSASTVLVMSGEPIDEELVSYGPFLMNTDAEIKQAFEDFRNGKFGYLDD
ncbi:MAG TPA: pirin family protein [Bacteroidales bacterium]|nr:pirin family protein [Bacteroidales bacterium]